ncbi:MAG: hypothetical protein ACLQVL_01845 [Terriglobia bacterium]
MNYESSGEEFYVEVSVQGLASKQLAVHQAMLALETAPWNVDPDLRIGGALKKMPAQDHFDEILRKVEEGRRIASTDGRLVDVSDGDALEMAVCPSNKLGELERWCGERGYRANGFAGPPDMTDAEERLGDKIKQEQDQVPPGCPNVLVLESSHVLSSVEPVIEEVIYELEEDVYRYPHVAIVVVRGGYDTNMHPLPWKFEKGEHKFQRRVTPWHVDQILVLSNRFAAVKPSEELRSRLLHAFFEGGLDAASA